MKRNQTLFGAAAVLSALLLLTGCAKEPVIPQAKPHDEPASLEVTPASITLAGHNGSAVLEVKASAAWTATPSETWLSVSPASGNGDGQVTVTAAEYPGRSKVRDGKILFAAGDLKKEVKLSQNSFETDFSGGSGTESDPYLISCTEDLVSLSERTNGSDAVRFAAAHYRQTVDIDLAGAAFTPLCQENEKLAFSGTYDGDAHKISHMTVHTPSVKKATAFIARANGATIRKINFEQADIDAGYVYSGTVVGQADNTTVSDIAVSGQFRQYVSGLQVVKEANEGFSGAIAGWVKNSTFENCVMDGNVTIYGKYSGGLIGVVENSTVRGCKLLKGNTVNIFYHWNGGLFGVVRGASSLISGCSFEGNLTAVGYIQGGIAGQVEGGRVENCVTGSYASLGCDKQFVGGIAGTLVPVDPIVVDHCAMYGTIKGQYAVGGIAGYCGFLTPASVKIEIATKDVTISNCACIGSEITATGNNGGSNLYSIASGLLAWSHGGNVLTIKGCYSHPALIQTVSTGNRGALAGLLAYQNSSQPALIKDCYSTVTPTNMLNRNERVTDVSSYPYYGGIYCRSTWPSRFEACFCDEAIKLGTGDSGATETACETLATAQFTDGTLLGKLQTAADGTVWVEGADKLPTVSGLPADPNVKPKAAKRVSVIGDSISTFKGWIPAGYGAHYPTTDGTLTLVNETYWYRLIHDYMKSAELDMNIAFSGSTVTNTTQENYTAKYGSTSNDWFKKDFVTRFIENGGCGRPDIILIHGGTNDYAHNADPLAPGVAIRNDASNIYGGTAPAASIMNGIYAKADAAKTRSEVNALPDGTFCEAYVKLLCQIRERYPQCKVVCIIGDYLSASIEQSVLQIAEHYGAKTVNLFRVNGFNDLGGYSPSTLSNKGKQPNMPKHDYAGDTGGCHPGSAAMEFIANKIYTELGPWLEN